MGRKNRKRQAGNKTAAQTQKSNDSLGEVNVSLTPRALTSEDVFEKDVDVNRNVPAKSSLSEVVRRFIDHFTPRKSIDSCPNCDASLRSPGSPSSAQILFNLHGETPDLKAAIPFLYKFMLRSSADRKMIVDTLEYLSMTDSFCLEQFLEYLKLKENNQMDIIKPGSPAPADPKPTSEAIQDFQLSDDVRIAGPSLPKTKFRPRSNSRNRASRSALIPPNERDESASMLSLPAVTSNPRVNPNADGKKEFVLSCGKGLVRSSTVAVKMDNLSTPRTRREEYAAKRASVSYISNMQWNDLSVSNIQPAVHAVVSRSLSNIKEKSDCASPSSQAIDNSRQECELPLVASSSTPADDAVTNVCSLSISECSSINYLPNSTPSVSPSLTNDPSTSSDISPELASLPTITGGPPAPPPPPPPVIRGAPPPAPPAPPPGLCGRAPLPGFANGAPPPAPPPPPPGLCGRAPPLEIANGAPPPAPPPPPPGLCGGVPPPPTMLDGFLLPQVVKSEETYHKTKKLQVLRWTRFSHAEVQKDQNVWNQPSKLEFTSDERDEIEKTFEQQIYTPRVSLVPKRKTSDESIFEEVQLDQQRQLQLELCLRKLRVTVDELVPKLESGNLEGLPVAELNTLAKVYPTDEELSRFSAFTRDKFTMKPSILCYYAANNSNLKMIIDLIVLEDSIFTELNEYGEQLNSLEDGMAAARDDMIVYVMHKCLKYGNFINQGTSMAGAAGFKLASLPEALTMKGKGNFTSVCLSDLVVNHMDLQKTDLEKLQQRLDVLTKLKLSDVNEAVLGALRISDGLRQRLDRCQNTDLHNRFSEFLEKVLSKIRTLIEKMGELRKMEISLSNYFCCNKETAEEICIILSKSLEVLIDSQVKLSTPKPRAMSVVMNSPSFSPSLGRNSLTRRSLNQHNRVSEDFQKIFNDAQSPK